MDKPLETLRKNIFRLMESREWTQADLARALKWEPQHLNNYLKRNEPGLDKIQEIAHVFGLQGWQLLRPEEPTKPLWLREVIGILISVPKDDLPRLLTIIRVLKGKKTT